MGLSLEQGRELELLLLEELGQDLAVELIKVENAQRTLEGHDIFQDVLGLGLPQGELVLLRIHLLNQVHKGMDHEGIVLGGHREGLLADGVLLVFSFHELDLVQDLTGINHELPAFIGQGDPRLLAD